MNSEPTRDAESVAAADTAATQLRSGVAPDASGDPGVGMQLGEFILCEELGRGSFGRVFLAEQSRLNRQVALKVSRQPALSDEEGKALGGLDHDHIVKVYSAFLHPESGWHCLSLQYIPGADLRSIITRLHEPGAPPLAGRAILDAVDAIGRKDTAFNPAALRDRVALAGADFPVAVCRIGRRLAEALAFAHAKGVLHCDIKPANILLTPYGRPMLADFNVAFHRDRKDSGSGLGGTEGYMAPEYWCAARERTTANVDERCDVYSLGVVLHELATGVRPAADTPPGGDPLDKVPRELAAVIRRCLEANPARRYQTAAELAESLDAASRLIGIRRSLPPAGPFEQRLIRHPVVSLALAALVPHFIASLVNISYNAVQIELTDAQDGAFQSLVLAYNLVVYPVCALVLFTALRGLGRRLLDLPRASAAEVDDVRRRARSIAWMAIWLGCLGWLPGGFLFPCGIDVLAGPLPWESYVHFAVSFTLSGLIGVVFSFLAVNYVLFRVLFPVLGHPDSDLPGGIADEVRPLVALFGPFLLLACAIPMTGAVLLVVLAEGPMPLGFRLFVAGLIGFGVAGVGIAERLTRRLSRLASVWETGVESDHQRQVVLSTKSGEIRAQA